MSEKYNNLTAISPQKSNYLWKFQILQGEEGAELRTVRLTTNQKPESAKTNSSTGEREK